MTPPEKKVFFGAREDQEVYKYRLWEEIWVCFICAASHAWRSLGFGGTSMSGKNKITTISVGKTPAGGAAEESCYEVVPCGGNMPVQKMMVGWSHES